VKNGAKSRGCTKGDFVALAKSLPPHAAKSQDHLKGVMPIYQTKKKRKNQTKIK
jgi:hypothetical protein